MLGIVKRNRIRRVPGPGWSGKGKSGDQGKRSPRTPSN